MSPFFKLVPCRPVFLLNLSPAYRSLNKASGILLLSVCLIHSSSWFLDICYLIESNTTVLPHVRRIILSNMVKLLEINFWKWAKWMCLFHAVLIQRSFFVTICARNAYLGSKLESEIFLPKEMTNFLPSFKQLRIKSDCDGWRELSNIARCDSCLSPTK